MSNRIAQIRQEKGLTLEDVARAAGTTKAQVLKLERGDRRLTLDWMTRLADALQVNVTALIPGESDEFDSLALDDELLEMLRMLSPRERRQLMSSIKNIIQLVLSQRKPSDEGAKPHSVL